MQAWARLTSARINTAIETLVAVLMLLLVLDVWLGVVDRCYFRWQLPWPEVMARYLMIWAAMLAISCGIARREHIGLTAFLHMWPAPIRRLVLILMDVLALALFLYVTWYGIAFAQSGATRHAMIFDLSLEPFYAAIPVSAAIASVQLFLVLLRDLGTHLELPAEGEAA